MQRKLPFSFEEFKAIYSQVPRLCVDLVIKQDGKVLLTLRKDYGWENQWHFPGGTVYYREPLEEAVQRIAQDEAGMEVKIEKMLGYMEFLDEEEERGFGYTVSIVFLCAPLKEGIVIGKWFNKLPKKMIRQHKDFLSKL